MHECVICQHTGTCTWQILMNETHVCNITYRHLSVLFCCIREFFVCLHTFRKEKEIIMAIFIELFLLGVGLSMDAFAVSVCKGLGMRKLNKKQAVIIGLYFGGFQALMPLIGWLLGSQFQKYITSIDHWIAFILLGFIGGKMIIEASVNGMKKKSSKSQMLRLITKTCLFLLLQQASTRSQSASRLLFLILRSLKQLVLLVSQPLYSLSSELSLATSSEANIKAKQNLSVV